MADDKVLEIGEEILERISRGGGMQRRAPVNRGFRPGGGKKAFSKPKVRRPKKKGGLESLRPGGKGRPRVDPILPQSKRKKSLIKTPGQKIKGALTKTGQRIKAKGTELRATVGEKASELRAKVGEKVGKVRATLKQRKAQRQSAQAEKERYQQTLHKMDTKQKLTPKTSGERHAGEMSKLQAKRDTRAAQIHRKRAMAKTGRTLRSVGSFAARMGARAVQHAPGAVGAAIGGLAGGLPGAMVGYAAGRGARRLRIVGPAGATGAMRRARLRKLSVAPPPSSPEGTPLQRALKLGSPHSERSAQTARTKLADIGSAAEREEFRLSQGPRKGLKATQRFAQKGIGVGREKNPSMRIAASRGGGG